MIGNCGFGFAPVLPELRDRSMLSMTRNEAISLDAMRAGMPWDWITFPEFLESVERTPKSVNILPYVPLTPLLVWVLGLDRAKAGVLATDAEHDEMCRLLDEAMDAGAGGWSAQRLFPQGTMAVQRDYDGTPMPTDVMHDETCRVLAALLATRGEGFIQMTLSSGDGDADRLRSVEGDAGWQRRATTGQGGRSGPPPGAEEPLAVRRHRPPGRHRRHPGSLRRDPSLREPYRRRRRPPARQALHRCLLGHRRGRQAQDDLLRRYHDPLGQTAPRYRGVPVGHRRRVQRAHGYSYVLVNGEVTIDHDKETGAPSGRLLRHGAAQPAVD